MAKTINKEERLLQKRKFYVRFLVIFTVFMLLAFNLGSWLFFNRMDDYLERELEKRLKAIASLNSKSIEADYIEEMNSFQENRLVRLLIRQQLNRLVYDFELESAFVIDRNNVVLIDPQSKFPEGQSLTYLQQDSAAIELAWSGQIAASPIHFVEGNKFKSVYAPLRDEFFSVSALLVLEASADFFELLDVFKQGLIVGGLVSFGLIVVFAFFISWMITLLIRTHEQVRQNEKLAAMGQMAASVAHEIRNPLGIIKGTADVLKEKYTAQNKKDELFDYIAAEVQRLNLLVNNFLSFAREPKLNLEKADIIAVIEKAVAAIEREEQEKMVQLNVNIADKPDIFAFDENTIQQVLFNLLINAKQAVEENGRVEVRLEIEKIKHAKFAKVIVSDNGTGIKEDKEKIFEPFYSTKSSGSGLGLAICKQIIEKHGGWIDFETELNKGTRFYFYLPMKD